MNKKQPGFFEEEKLDRISQLGDLLEKLNRQINWKYFCLSSRKHLTKKPKVQAGDQYLITY
jgi:hypothetical protein